MPRKTATRRPCDALRDVSVGYDDIVSPLLVDYLLTVPTWAPASAQDSRDASPPRSVKRRKVETGPYASPVSIAKGELSFSRRCADAGSADISTFVPDAGSQLQFGLVDDCLTISSRRLSSRSRSVSVRISLTPQEVTESAKRILKFPWFDTQHARPGSIGKAVGMHIDRRGKTISMKLTLELFWNETRSPYVPQPRSIDRKTSQMAIDACFPLPDADRDASAWSPMDFYEAAYVPPKSDEVAQEIQVPGLQSTLFPFQKRTLRWLLSREGMRFSHQESRLEPIPDGQRNPNIDSFRTVRDANGEEVYVSDVFQTITRDTQLYRQAHLAVKGGILAEEMGLGKTLEVLGLILLHRRPNSPTPGDANAIEPGPKPGRATLIVTPESLRQQWMSEISRHAPGLRVMHYQGCKKNQDSDVDEIASELAEYDIVITTYAVLSAEMHFALEPPARSRRYERAYPRTMSPLVKISWWRLCLDEAQMIENGYSHAAAVARAIPRVNAWGITGTPVKDDVRDLYGLLLFLRYEPYCHAQPAWQSLVQNHKTMFQRIFRSIALRHTKSLVRDEISLPPQKRYVISMPFTAVEEQHYQSLFKQMAEECGLDLDGAPLVEGWDPGDYEDVMRTWLNRLRQTTLHPEVGAYNRRILGSGKARPMRTVEEVLDAMLEQSESTIRIEERAYLSSKLNRGQLYENGPEVQQARALWEEVRSETEKLVAGARARLTDSIRENGGDEASEELAEDTASMASSGSDNEREGGERRGRIGESRRRLRSALEMHHKAVFFCANAYFQIRDNPDMTDPESEEYERLKKLEDEGYEEAKKIRKEILRESHRKASRLMGKIARNASGQSFVQIPELAVKAERGIESGRVVDDLEVLYGELNEQANTLDEWREEVVQLLLRPLVDEDDDLETTGEELADSVKFQDLLLVYYQVLRTAIADRMEAISGQKNELVRHEAASSMKLAREGEGPAPEKMLEMLGKRTATKPKLALMSMRGAISEFRGLQSRVRGAASSDGSREALEAKIAADQLTATQAQLNEQNKAALALETEIETFKAAMNTRLEYYRQLQAVSDAVLPYEGAKSDEVARKMEQVEEEVKRKLQSAQAKHRYLQNLKETGSRSKEPRMCVICQTAFATGVLTVCGHQFCKEGA
ncbi:hypothetical protein CDD83_2251 [Cordyceps sp. RAO-2017]|nr:hypothetical protein CDD83_2251 [Cordyceps sp. RAO-2017]